MTDEELSEIKGRLRTHACAEIRACGWCCLLEAEVDVLQLLAEVERLREHESLVEKAARHHGTPEDIPTWADRIASEYGKLND